MAYPKVQSQRSQGSQRSQESQQSQASQRSEESRRLTYFDFVGTDALRAIRVRDDAPRPRNEYERAQQAGLTQGFRVRRGHGNDVRAPNRDRLGGFVNRRLNAVRGMINGVHRQSVALRNNLAGLVHRQNRRSDPAADLPNRVEPLVAIVVNDWSLVFDGLVLAELPVAQDVNNQELPVAAYVDMSHINGQHI